MVMHIVHGRSQDSASFHCSHRCCRLSFSVRVWTGLLVLAALVLISPLFFTDKLRNGFRLSVLPPLKISSALNAYNVGEAFLKPSSSAYTLQPNICPPTGRQPYLVLFIPSRPGFAEERAAVRETWGTHGRLCNVRVVFGFGSFSSAELQHEVFVENSIYGDLLQSSTVLDAYHNQTRLVLSFFEWGAANCQRAEFIGKADEDAWINIFGVLRYLQYNEAPRSIIGHFLYKEEVKRLPEQKWFLTKEEYVNDTYPPFAVGQLYIFPQKFIPQVLWASRQLTVHWLDDVFIAGQIPHLLNMNLLHIWERTNLWEVEGLYCFGRNTLIIHATPAQKKREIFYDKCMQAYRQSANCVAQVAKPPDFGPVPDPSLEEKMVVPPTTVPVAMAVSTATTPTAVVPSKWTTVTVDRLGSDKSPSSAHRFLKASYLEANSTANYTL